MSKSRGRRYCAAPRVRRIRPCRRLICQRQAAARSVALDQTRLGCQATVRPGWPGAPRDTRRRFPARRPRPARRRRRPAAVRARSQAGIPASRRTDFSARRGRSDATWKRSPPARERTRTSPTPTARRSMPAPSAWPKTSVPCGSASSGSPRQRHVEARRRRGMQRDPALVHADFDARMREPDHGVAARTAQLVEHRGETRGRWRRQSLAAQEPAQQVARAMRRRARRAPRVASVAVQRAVARPAAPVRRAGARLPPGARRRAPAWLGLRRDRGSAGSTEWRTALRAWRSSALLSSSIQAQVAVARVRVDVARAERRAAGATRSMPSASSRNAGIAARPCGPAPRSNCSSSVSAWSLR